MSYFDDILRHAKVEDSDRAVFEKYPALKATVEDVDARLKGHEAWRTAHFDDALGMTKEEAALRQQLTAEQSQRAALEARGETEMTFDEILAQANPHIKSAVDAAVNPLRSAVLDAQGNPKVPSNDDFLASLVGMQTFYGKTMALPAQHYREFGEDLDGEAFVRWTAEHKLGADPKLAYDQYVSDKRTVARTAADAKRETETQAKIDAARKEGEESARRTLAAQSGRSLPTAGEEASPMGPLQRRVVELRNPEEAKKSAKTDPTISLNDARLSQMAAEEFVRKQMGGAA